MSETGSNQPSGDIVWNIPAAQMFDQIPQQQLAFFQPLHLQLIKRALAGDPIDHVVKVAMLRFERREPIVQVIEIV